MIILLSRAMEIVMYCLELDSGSVSRGELDLGKIDADEPSPKVFSSDLGTSLVAESLRQQAMVQYLSNINFSSHKTGPHEILEESGRK